MPAPPRWIRLVAFPPSPKPRIMFARFCANSPLPQTRNRQSSDLAVDRGKSRPHAHAFELYIRMQRIDGWRPPVSIEHFVEEVQVLGKDLVDRVKTLIHEGNVNRIIIKDDKGQTFVEIPVTLAAVGAVAAPV